MNKSDLITALSNKEDLTEKDTKTIIDLVFDCFTKTLKDSGRIESRGFGSFSAREYKSYTGRNTKTGKGLEVKSKRLPFFKVGKELKQKVDS